MESRSDRIDGRQTRKVVGWSVDCDRDTWRLDYCALDLADRPGGVAESLQTGRCVLETWLEVQLSTMVNVLDRSVKSFCRLSSKESQFWSRDESETRSLSTGFVSTSFLAAFIETI